MRAKKLYLLLALGLALAALGLTLKKEYAFDALAAAPRLAPAGQRDAAASPYFAAPSLKNLQARPSLALIENFPVRQQETGYTCGACCAAMLLDYWRPEEKHSEAAVARALGTNPASGTQLAGLVKYFRAQGYRVASSLETSGPADYAAFQSFLREHLAQKTPILVENVAWGGHYRVIIGYDDMGTAFTADDVLILADPYDLADHKQDGYAFLNAQKFFAMWFDVNILPRSQRTRPWLTARPLA